MVSPFPAGFDRPASGPARAVGGLNLPVRLAVRALQRAVDILRRS